jgi:hypothetical protein
MSQHDMDIANQGFVAFRADVNDALQALASNNSGATAPGTTYAYQWWADTTAGILKQRNAANSAWIPIGPLADLGIQTGAQSLATVGGTADALTLTFSPALAALHGGIFQFVAASDNATTTPTANLDGLGAKTFIKGNNLALVAGDIKSGMTMLARYDSALAKLSLLNPATGVAPAAIADGSITPAKLSGAQTGSAPAIACRATALVDGTLTGTNAPTWGVNITNVQRTATGTYLVTFATAMPHANYAVVFGGLNTSTFNVNYLVRKNGGIKTTTQFEFVCVSGDRSAFQDNTDMSIAFFA